MDYFYRLNPVYVYQAPVQMKKTSTNDSKGQKKTG
jgi:hypothetical protein